MIEGIIIAICWGAFVVWWFTMAVRTGLTMGPPPMETPTHGNLTAESGCDRCECGCKYWEYDRCIDCGTTHEVQG